MFLEVNHIKKVYGKGGAQTVALRDVDFGVQAGEFVAIMGESGSGKSTLLNMIATFDAPTSGDIILNGQNLASVKEAEQARFRRERLGFVFQSFNVLNTFNNKDNILLPLVLSNTPVKEMEARLEKLAPLLGIQDYLKKYPYEISGGQRQRIAIARAVITRPDMILADEPTGALDSRTSDQTMALFDRLNQAGNTILMVTHSIRAASACQRVLFIRDGRIYNELYRGESSQAEYQERISNTLSLLNQGGE
ncbi:MAG: ABC transporter ATP-binding protein [Aerococcus sp.]|nr:ABC transporter ATP-binding protein [Aerococcus sp.]